MDSDERERRLDLKLEAWRYRVKDANERKTYDEVFDQRTLLTLQRLISRNIFEILDYPVSTGKEGNVFKATTKGGEARAIKIYRTSNATFKNLSKYIVGDPRFGRLGSNRRRLISAWATKEFKNLKRMESAGTHVPKPIHVEGNVLVTSYLGDETGPAPLVRNLNQAEARPLVDPIVRELALIRKASLVHGDLSEYNILVWEGEPWIIDVGQAVPLDHPLAEEWFQRDMRNIARYFKRLGEDITPEELAIRVRSGRG